MRRHLIAFVLAGIAAAGPVRAGDYFLACDGAMHALDRPGSAAEPMTVLFHVDDARQSVSFQLPGFPGFRNGCRPDAVKTVTSWDETVAFHCGSPSGAKHDISLHVPDKIRMETNAPGSFDNLFEGICKTTPDPRPARPAG